MPSIGYAAKHSWSRLKPLEFDRRAVGPDDVAIDVLYCGVCHSDLHQVKNDWGNTIYPCMPGHEIVGRVREVGAAVKNFAVGDIAGIGCMVDSCGECHSCKGGEEQYCEGPKGWTATYNGPQEPDGTNTYGGYSNEYVVREKFLLKIPDGLDPAKAAPILCAGVTTWSPMQHWGVKAGDKVAVAGFGGLGHMATKLAVSLGCEVTVLSRSTDKRSAIEKTGAKLIAEDDKDALEAAELSFDFIIDTIPEGHDVNPFVSLLKRDGVMVLVGALEPNKAVDNSEVAFHRRTIAGSLIGSLKETQDVLDHCAAHGVAPEIEIIPIQDINKAFADLEKGDVPHRFVIDLATLEKPDETD